ncbi:CHAT domain-containing protein [Kitasatospora sp. NPDC015120]|uniref:CHAT domain-containing protein n=1 Tax=Kitasatospora sp. NPDC015120 TaxID=3364023 RepID=UPI0036F4AA9F
MTDPKPTRILMLSAVAVRLGGPDTGEEQRQVTQTLRAARFRDGIRLETGQALQGKDILGHLLHHNPNVLHLSGHADESGLRVLTPAGGDAPMATKGLANLLAEVGKEVRLAFLNACATGAVARELAEVVGCAIGHPAKVRDDMAIMFADHFYQCIGTGMTVGPSFRAAQAALGMYVTDEASLPVLHHRADVNPDALHLLHPAFMPPPSAPGRAPDATAFLARRAGAKQFIALVTGSAESEAELRAEFIEKNVDILWIREDGTTDG